MLAMHGSRAESGCAHLRLDGRERPQRPRGGKRVKLGTRACKGTHARMQIVALAALAVAAASLALTIAVQ
eukprot:4753005-Pleurochrysis_carterae.AAC.5